MKRILGIASVLLIVACQKDSAAPEFRSVRVEKKNLRATVQSMAEIQPLNKVEILPQVSGRIDAISVEEGSVVKKGQELARISSSDRAALLDAARSKGATETRYWEEVYRATPILAPVPGRVIQKNVVPGQTVSTSTVLFQLSDRLIFRAQVDETDIAQVHLGTAATAVVDAFPNRPIEANVRLVRQQAKLINNVNIYEVELDPDSTIDDLRAGMTATVEFILREKSQALALPLSATDGKEKTTISLEVEQPEGKSETRTVTLGEAFGPDVEILSGLSAGDSVRVLLRKVSAESTQTKSLFPFGSARKAPPKKP